MIPTLRERAPDADAQRRLPDETLDDFISLGLLRAVRPVRFGGMGHDLEVIVDFCQEVARGCGASGWLSSFMAIGQHMIGWFPEEAQQEFWADSPDTVSASAPGYRMAREVESGGVRLSGQAAFSSGIDHAEWLLLHTTVEQCLVPRSDFEIVDDWHVSGLKATGSKSVRVDDIFVPEHRIVTNQQLATATHPGARMYDSPWYHVSSPHVLALNHFILAPVIGMARGVLDIFDERAQGRLDGQVFEPAVECAGPQLRFTEASAEIDVADMLLRRNLGVLRESGATGTPLPLDERAEIRRNVVYAAKLVTQATNRLVDGMDSSALYLRNLLHRQASDVRAGGLQFTLHWEETAMDFARIHWGLEPSTRILAGP
jgi:alkylation response protein AidB-like acyl-CoA dehydrogenase